MCAQPRESRASGTSDREDATDSSQRCTGTRQEVTGASWNMGNSDYIWKRVFSMQVDNLEEVAQTGWGPS